MKDIAETLREMYVLNEHEAEYLDGILRSEPIPTTAKELAQLIKQARKYGKKEEKS